MPTANVRRSYARDYASVTCVTGQIYLISAYLFRRFLLIAFPSSTLLRRAKRRASIGQEDRHGVAKRVSGRRRCGRRRGRLMASMRRRGREDLAAGGRSGASARHDLRVPRAHAGGGGAPPASADANAPARGPPAFPVAVAPVKRADFPIVIEGLGQVQAYNTVTVRARVDGQIIKIGFEEGQTSRRAISSPRSIPRPFQAALDQAKAKKTQDEANLANAKLDLQRYSTLAKQSFATQQQLDTQNALVNQLIAQIAADAAAIDAAQVQLDYTTIRAPICRPRRLPADRRGQHGRRRRSRPASSTIAQIAADRRRSSPRRRTHVGRDQRGAEGRRRRRSRSKNDRRQDARRPASWTSSTTRSTPTTGTVRLKARVREQRPRAVAGPRGDDRR